MKHSGNNQKLGRWGEMVASHYLELKGYQIRAHNYRTTFGEIDLIAHIDGVTVFVEVKTRSGLGYGFPEEAVTATKRAHLLDSVKFFWQSESGIEGDWRIDVVAVIGRPGRGEPQIEHFENVDI
jgi:putative endonuclease